jgi:hypothetical protein
MTMKTLRLIALAGFVLLGLNACTFGISAGDNTPAPAEPDWASAVTGNYKGTFLGSTSTATVTISRADNKLVNMAIDGGSPARNIDLNTATTMYRVLTSADSPSFAGYTLDGTFSGKTLTMTYKDTGGKVQFGFTGTKP